jgi:hypothetical protein
MISLIKLPINLKIGMPILLLLLHKPKHKGPAALCDLRPHFKGTFISQPDLTLPGQKLQHPIIIPRSLVLLLVGVGDSVVAAVPHVFAAPHEAVDVEGDDVPEARFQVELAVWVVVEDYFGGDRGLLKQGMVDRALAVLD